MPEQNTNDRQIRKEINLPEQYAKIGKTLDIEGEISGRETLSIEGRFQGKISLETFRTHQKRPPARPDCPGRHLHPGVHRPKHTAAR